MRTLLLGVWLLCAAPLAQRAGDSVSTNVDLPTASQERCRIEVIHRATLGKLEDPVSVGIPMEAYVAEIPWGGWVVTEDGNDVIEYDSSGGFRRILGRRGEGPEEFRRPSSIAVDATDSTWVSDPRGRAVIVGPDGVPARTLLSPQLYQIEGFTEAGLPLAMLLKVDRSGGDLTVLRYIQIWSRDGEPLAQLGPANFSPEAQGTIHNEATALQGVVMGDTLGVVPASWENWLTFWSASREWGTVPADSVWRTLALNNPPESFADGRPVAVSSDGAGGFWVLGVVRRLSEAREESLIRMTGSQRGESADVYKKESAPVSNAVYDGVIIHVALEGTVTGGMVFEDFPRGFSGPRQFYTFTETDQGLIQIQIWEASRVGC